MESGSKAHGYLNNYNYQQDDLDREAEGSGSSGYQFGSLLFYGNEAENETEIWTNSAKRMKLSVTSTSASPFPLLQSQEDIASFAFTGKGHRHHHSQHYNQHKQFHNNFNVGSGSSAAQNLIDTAVSMASGVLDDIVTSTSSSPSPASFQHYFETDFVTTGMSGDQLVTDTDFTMNETTNSSIFMPVRDPLYITIPITVIYATILLVGLLGNIVTCIVIIRSRYLHTTTNYYLFSLAISDLLLLLSGLPVEMYSMWKRYPYIFGDYFCIGRGLAAETSSNATVLTITAFTIERYLAICRPFMIQKWQNKLSRVVRQIIIIWVISISLAIPQALQFGVVPQYISLNETSTFCLVKQPLIEHSFEIATFVFFVAPMILITVLYCLIGLTLRNASNVKESKVRLRKSLSNHKREVGQQRVLKMLVAVVVAFFVCWAPFHAQRLIASFNFEHSEDLKTAYFISTYVSGVLYYLSTCINPILYHIMSLKFRHAFQACFTCSYNSNHENYNNSRVIQQI